MSEFSGYPIVLTADRTLMADYRLLFDGMLAASLTTTTPPALLGGLLMPRAGAAQHRAAVAPLGLRRIEAALVEGGFTPDEVAVVPEPLLRYAIGPNTRIIGIDSGEPTGIGMNSTTMAGIAGGTIYPHAMFRHLLKTIRRAMAKAPNARVVLGGPGAWQMARAPAQRQCSAIDHTIVGYAEGNVAALFRDLINGVPVPALVSGEGPPAHGIPSIRGASTMGVVETSRGCGWGCKFCTISRTPMQHLPEETILADVRTNVEAGHTSIAALSEDLFRYGAIGAEVAPHRLIELLTRMRQIPALRLIQVDHVNLASAARYTDEQLIAVRKLLVGNTGVKFPWVNVGVESASGALLRSNGGGVKMARCDDGDWADFSAKQVRRLIHSGFLPMVSLVIGLPGETDGDIDATIRWVESFAGERATIFPVIYAPVDGAPPVPVRSLTRAHWQLIRKAYTLNFRWIPPMYWDNQTGAGTPAWKKILLQGMGHGQVLEWQAFFAWHSRRARR